MIGDDPTQGLRELTDVGMKTIGEHELGNPSGTSRGAEAIGLLRRIVNPIQWPKLAGETLGANVSARAFTSPRLTRALTSPSEPLRAGGLKVGLAGRGLTLYPDDKKQQDPFGFLFENQQPPPAADPFEFLFNRP